MGQDRACQDSKMLPWMGDIEALNTMDSVDQEKWFCCNKGVFLLLILTLWQCHFQRRCDKHFKYSFPFDLHVTYTKLIPHGRLVSDLKPWHDQREFHSFLLMSSPNTRRVGVPLPLSFPPLLPGDRPQAWHRLAVSLQSVSLKAFLLGTRPSQWKMSRCSINVS